MVHSHCERLNGTPLSHIKYNNPSSANVNFVVKWVQNYSPSKNRFRIRFFTRCEGAFKIKFRIFSRYLLLLTSDSAVDDLLHLFSREPVFFLSFPIHPGCYGNSWHNHNKLISSRIHLYNDTKLISLKESRFTQICILGHIASSLQWHEINIS